jgi:hypothetical protein
MSELYLILHKVRGEPAFDIATPLPIGDEEGWIIPTSGHRAYPYWSYRLDALDAALRPYPEVCPDGWVDHYQANASHREARAFANSLLASLGLPTKVHTSISRTLKRRI